MRKFPILKIKEGATVEGITPECALAQFIAWTVWFSMGFKGDCRITSGTDDAPGRLPDSKHKVGDAFDLGIWNVGDRVQSLARTLRKALGDEYDVVVEPDHIHIEFDPPTKEGEENGDEQKESNT